MWSFRRTLAAVGAVAVSITCADHSVGPRRTGLARLPIAPVFHSIEQEGGPRIPVAIVQGVLRRSDSADSSVASAVVRGDSAVLQFERILVNGDSTVYQLVVRAFDAESVLVFKGLQDIAVKPGENAPAAPWLEYTAPDALVAELDVVAGTDTVTEVDLQWAGARVTDPGCLNRIASPAAITDQQLSVVGRKSDDTEVPEIRVGWSSRDTSVATVDANGRVRSRCSNKSTYIVARTYLGVTDSVRVDVTAPAFTLLMEPAEVDLPRQDSVQLVATLVDENGNPVSTTTVDWSTSDSSRATVSASGWVRGFANGRAVVTATSGNRTTVAVVDVVPPLASGVTLAPVADTLAVGQSRLYQPTSVDGSGALIPDADRYEWFTTNPSVARVNASGLVTGVAAGSAFVIVKIDSRKDTTEVFVRDATDGAVTGVVVDPATGIGIAGATVSRAGGPSATTDSSGSFALAGLVPGDDLDLVASGYASVVFLDVPVRLGQTLYLGELPMASSSGGAGTISASIVNALDDSPVVGATVSVFANINAPSTNPNSGVTTPAAIAQASTDALGTATFAAIPPGTYTYLVTAPGFSFTRKVVVSIAGLSLSTRVALAPVVGGDMTGLRVVLTWGDCQGGASNLVPCDLDSHVTGPTLSEVDRFHVAYFNGVYRDGSDTVAVLDNDATNGLGPETITLRPRATGVYKYYVHNYSDAADSLSTRLNSARARVDVYKGSSLIATFFPPPNRQGVLWAVFQVEGSTITAVNEMIRIQDFPIVPRTFLRALKN
jgi:hypothetical protein